MSTFLGSLVARAVASTVLADPAFVTAGGVRYRTDATRADTVDETEDGATMHRIVVRFPSEDVPVAIGRGTKVEMGGKTYQALYAHQLEDIWQVGLTVWGGIDARP